MPYARTARRVGLIPSLFAFSLVLLFCAVFSGAARGQIGQWAWMGGSNQDGVPSVYDTEYVFADSNMPGGRIYPSAWTDTSGRFWLFGGRSAGIYTDDLWVFDLSLGSHGQWALMSGSLNPDTTGTYGTEYQFEDSNSPGARWGSVSWTDPGGTLWLFSGVGLDGTSHFGTLNDLWNFDPARGTHGQWAWMGGSSLRKDGATVDAVKYEFADGNIPGTRFGATAAARDWAWVFGGSANDSSGTVLLDELWAFDPKAGAHGQWALMNSSGQTNQQPVYGTQYEFAPTNSPGARWHATSWVDASGRFWLFGGGTHPDWYYNPSYNDLWVFDPSQGLRGEWAWMSGGNVWGIYGTKYQFAATNTPGARESAVSWIDQKGKLWLYGGEGYGELGNEVYLSDLWAFDPSQGTHGEWAWMSGPSRISYGDMCTPIQPGDYSNEYQFASENMPGSHLAGASWIDASGNLWMFAGLSSNPYRQMSEFAVNDFWKFSFGVPFGSLEQAMNARTRSTTVTQSDDLLVSGWAADVEDGAPVSQAQILIDGTAVGNATLGLSRTDVKSYPNSGWSFTYAAAGLSLGTHTVSAVATDSLSQSSVVGTKAFTVATVSTGSPFGVVDQAVDASTKSTNVGQAGYLEVSGWVADPQDGAPVSQVQVLVDGTAIGNATLGLSRPDVKGYPNSGWWLKVPASGLSLGTHSVSAIATDSLSKSTTLARTRSITVTTGP
jgi:hypothetical protein